MSQNLVTLVLGNERTRRLRQIGSHSILMVMTITTTISTVRPRGLENDTDIDSFCQRHSQTFGKHRPQVVSGGQCDQMLELKVAQIVQLVATAVLVKKVGVCIVAPSNQLFGLTFVIKLVTNNCLKIGQFGHTGGGSIGMSTGTQVPATHESHYMLCRYIVGIATCYGKDLWSCSIIVSNFSQMSSHDF